MPTITISRKGLYLVSERIVLQLGVIVPDEDGVLGVEIEQTIDTRPFINEGGYSLCYHTDAEGNLTMLDGDVPSLLTCEQHAKSKELFADFTRNREREHDDMDSDQLKGCFHFNESIGMWQLMSPTASIMPTLIIARNPSKGTNFGIFLKGDIDVVDEYGEVHPANYLAIDVPTIQIRHRKNYPVVHTTFQTKFTTINKSS